MASNRTPRPKYPTFETINLHDDTWRAYTEYRGMPVTAYEHSPEAAETKAREYIARHYAR